jgi:hypothetical protein
MSSKHDSDLSQRLWKTAKWAIALLFFCFVFALLTKFRLLFIAADVVLVIGILIVIAAVYVDFLRSKKSFSRK